jgi:perosamine synthetase
MNPILNIAEDHNLYVIEDAAEAHGAEYKGKKVGSFGDISCFSFYGNKIITTGEGGMCLTDDENLLDKMVILRDHAMSPNKRYWHEIIGFNYRMTNLQAAVGVAQVKRLDKFVYRKREIANRYAEYLGEMKDLELIKLHPQMPWAKCIYWMYSILVENKFGIGRDQLMKELESRGVETRPFFFPLHVMKPYKSMQKFPATEEIASKGINLPSGHILKDEDIRYVANSIVSMYRN